VVAVAMLLSALGLVAAGCGGGNSDKRANETYATGVCRAIDTWATQVKTLATVPTGEITTASLDAKLSQFETAAQDARLGDQGGAATEHFRGPGG
jgi:hypothetical protein